ncbi:MAG: hypothetical protein M1820_007875 [Bogoriella megaspora]|nr:MAG: hypothetical protein M1820_007875 [Bogoriella megaspora]
MARLSTRQRLQTLFVTSNALMQSALALNTNNSIASSTSISSTASVSSNTGGGVGNYVAQGLGIAVSPASSSSSSQISLPPQSRTNPIIGSSTYTENAQGAYVFPLTTYTPGDPGFTLNGTLITIAGAAAVTRVPSASSNNITEPPSLTSSSTMSEQTTFSFQNSSDPNRWCATAGAKYPAQKDVISCYCSLSSWYSSYLPYSSRYLTQTNSEGILTGTSGIITYNSTTTETDVKTTTEIPTDVTPFTLCDGWPRVNQSPVTRTVTSTSAYENVLYELAQGHPFAPKPTCSVGGAGCAWLYYNASLPGGVANGDEDHARMNLCGTPAHLGSPCLVSGGPIKLLYFPEPSDPRGLCNSTNATSFSNYNNNLGIANQANNSLTTVESLGTTFTSGTAYLSISTLYASRDGFWDRIGPTFSNYILPLASSQVHTICYNWDGPESMQLGNPLNFQDLNCPIPATAYSCASGCMVPAFATATAPCTIWDNFAPILALPTAITQIAPEWSTCSLWDENINNFWFDPPTALVPQTAAASPTDTFQPITTKAAPSSNLPGTSPAQETQTSHPHPPPPAPPPSSDPASPVTDPQTAHTSHASASAQPSNPAPSIISIIASSHPNSPQPALSQPALSQPAPVDPGSDTSIPAATSSESISLARSPNPGSIIPSIIGGSPSTGAQPPSSSSPAVSDPAVIIPSIVAGSSAAGTQPIPSVNSPVTSTLDTSSTTPISSSAPHLIGTIGTQPISADPGDPSGVVVGGQSLAPGHQTTIDGHTASVAPDGVIVDGSTLAIPAASAAAGDPNAQSKPNAQSHSLDESQPGAVVTLASSILTAAPLPGSSGVVTIGSNTLSAGGAPATIGDQTISAAESAIVIEGSSVQFSSARDPGAASSAAVLTLGSSTITATPIAGSSGIFQIGETKVTVGGLAAVSNGQTISAAPSGIVVEGPDGGSTAIFSSAAAPAGEAVFTANGKTFTAQQTTTNGHEIVVMSGAGIPLMSITVGSTEVTANRMTLSAAPSGVVIDGSLRSFSSPSSAEAEAEATLTLGGDAITVSGVAEHTNEVAVDGTTLTEGSSAVVINGQTVSLGTDGIVEGGEHPSTTITTHAGTTKTADYSHGSSSTARGTVATATTAGAESITGFKMSILIASFAACTTILLIL